MRKLLKIFFQAIKDLEDENLQLMLNYEINSCEVNREAMYKCRSTLMKAYANEEVYWRQTSSVKWIKKGDSNSKFFHKCLKVENHKLKIHSILDENDYALEEFEDIKKHILNFYEDQLKA